jgi:hypothetical protein
MNQNPKKLTLWVRGQLWQPDKIWTTWNDAMNRFTTESSIDITHIGAASASFKSGNYLSYRHVRKRLAASLSSREPFEYLSFTSVPKDFYTMAGDLVFEASLRAHPHQEALVYFREERFSHIDLIELERLASALFESGRIEWFRNDASDYPGNYLINFAHPNGYKPKGFESISVKTF